MIDYSLVYALKFSQSSKGGPKGPHGNLKKKFI